MAASSASASLSSASKAASKSLSSASSIASKSASSGSSAASAALSSASSSASVAGSSSLSSGSSSLSSGSSLASSALTSASSTASPFAKNMTGTMPSAGHGTAYTYFTTTAILVTVIAVVLAGIYFSGYADDVAEYVGKKYYKAKATAEVKAFENTQSEKAESFLKDSLKKNPIMGEDELEQVSGGLGKEASMEGLGGTGQKIGRFGEIIG